MKQRGQIGWLLLGDTLAIWIVTMLGFLSHYREIAGWRWLSTFMPGLAAWLVISPWLGVYRGEVFQQPRRVWRPGLAALLSAPLAATLRGFWLNEAIPPVFVLVLGLTNTLGLLLWRLAWAWFAQRASRRVVSHG